MTGRFQPYGQDPPTLETRSTSPASGSSRPSTSTWRSSRAAVSCAPIMAMIWVTQRRRKSGFCSGRASATAPLRAVARLIRASRSTWLPSPRNPAQSPRNRLAVGSLATRRTRKSSKEIREAVSDRGGGVRSRGERPPTRGAPKGQIHEKGTTIMKLTITTNVSVDGVMQGLGGSDEDRRGGFERGGWAIPLLDTEAGDHINKVYGGASAFLFGRRTYEIFARSWGAIEEMRALPIGVALNGTPKYVVSTTLTDPQWAGTTVLTGDVAAAVRDLKAQQDGELLFPDSGPDTALDLVESRSTPKGITIQVYRPTGRPRYETATQT